MSFSITIQLSQGAFDSALRFYPNPTKNASSVNIDFTLTVPSVVTIEIFDILGEKVYSENYGSLAAGSVSKTWALVNSGGAKVGSGLYLVRIKAAGTTNTIETTKKLVVIR